ncbi:hypothetical protein KHA80_18525 [Anaerobacillus sp. HL2]|nr:hypothetical protein KHA80_18525 [Anaerobacillus sp. HL2]
MTRRTIHLHYPSIVTLVVMSLFVEKGQDLNHYYKEDDLWYKTTTFAKGIKGTPFFLRAAIVILK